MFEQKKDTSDECISSRSIFWFTKLAISPPLLGVRRETGYLHQSTLIHSSIFLHSRWVLDHLSMLLYPHKQLFEIFSVLENIEKYFFKNWSRSIGKNHRTKENSTEMKRSRWVDISTYFYYFLTPSEQKVIWFLQFLKTFFLRIALVWGILL